MAYKYVRFENGRYQDGPEDFIIIFPGSINHKSFARTIRGKPVSAGKVDVDVEGKYYAYDESESLNLKSNPEADSKLLNIQNRIY